ncbi:MULTISPECIES: ribose 5-phosphate isomerase B [unclassified Schaalia]|uniref:ribose 5-phosphate isomerase B n=1 Tax=unclassified Schaalia TaxID=2691889 RepID=UPI001E4AE8FA|nr:MULTISPECIES: ribose 5-phosphate isomerase B [unclassified Schaalia]MCD4549002.1 ribose 5-phosphate isomerase B [Schaalia sp. lx-260]MCD4557614.1 ribose 5-phosphate isomerase B [Schaalia sp. lx-100]
MKIVFGADHAGVELKDFLREYAQQLGHEVIDIGTHDDQSVHYPLFGRQAAEVLAAGEADRAVIVCGTGVGISLAANSVPGVRCVVCSEPFTAQLSRQHNDANALALGARVVGPGLAAMIMDSFLSTEFEGGRHQIRVDMLIEYDNTCGQ